MAINSQPISPIQQARVRRIDLSRYLKIDGSRYLLGVVVLLCLMSLIALAQTGVVATKGYAIAQFEQQKVDLLRERTQLQLRHAAAQSLARVRTRAEQIGLRPMSAEQARYLAVQPVSAEQIVTHDQRKVQSEQTMGSEPTVAPTEQVLPDGRPPADAEP